MWTEESKVLWHCLPDKSIDVVKDVLLHHAQRILLADVINYP
jgi:hypothetical protein